jgi:hypothetical protein
MYNIRVIQHREDCWSVKVERTVKPLRCVAHLYATSEKEAEEIRQRFEMKYVSSQSEEALRRDAQMQEWPKGKPAYKPEEW